MYIRNVRKHGHNVSYLFSEHNFKTYEIAFSSLLLALMYKITCE
jgi:hypothetical protein